MASLIFSFCLAAGLWGLWRLVERRESLRWARWHGMTAAVGLLVAGFSGGREAMRPTPLHSTRLHAVQLDSTPLPQVTFDPRWGAKRESDYLARWREVYAAIGPPPTPSAIPKRGYLRGGKPVAPSWQTRPDGDESNNLVKSP